MERTAEQPIWHYRLQKLITESLNFISANTQRLRETVVVRGVPKHNDKFRITYRFGVRGEPLPIDVVEEFRDILARGRSVLDIAMFDTVSKQATAPLSNKDQRRIYFPIAPTATSWKSAENKPYFNALTQNQHEKLKSIQPFITGNEVIHEFSQIHNEDKHRSPLRLAVIPDSEFVMIFDHVNPTPDSPQNYSIEWVHPLPEVETGVDFVEYRTTTPIRSAGIEDVPVALNVKVNGEWRDVQHLLWDVIEFIVRATTILEDGDSSLADAFKGFFDLHRGQLSAFRKTVIDHDLDAETEWLRLTGNTRAPHTIDDPFESHLFSTFHHSHPAASIPGRNHNSLRNQS